MPERTTTRALGVGVGQLTTVLLALLTMTVGSAPLSWADVPAPPSRDMTLRYGPEPHQLLELLLPGPALSRGRRPVVVYLHPGGWIAGDRTGIIDAARAQVDRGYAVASIEYRLATTPGVASFPGAVGDVKRAIRYLKAKASTWNLDARRVILMGASAGGHLAAFVGATAGIFEPPALDGILARVDSSVIGIVDLVGPADLVSFASTDNPLAAPLSAALLGCPAERVSDPTDCSMDLLHAASVAPYVDPADPPIFLAYGGQDGLVVAATQGRPLADAWARVHPGNAGAVWYRELAQAGHNLPRADFEADLDRFLDGVRDGSLRARALTRQSARQSKYAEWTLRNLAERLSLR